jgi:hypothetical protein
MKWNTDLSSVSVNNDKLTAHPPSSPPHTNIFIHNFVFYFSYRMFATSPQFVLVILIPVVTIYTTNFNIKEGFVFLTQHIKVFCICLNMCKL